MEHLLHGLLGIVPYFDDVLIAATSRSGLIEVLRKVLDRFRGAGLKLKLSKCSFAVPRVEFLGFMIHAQGIHPTRSKVAAIKNAPAPTSKAELQAFLCLLNFYTPFLPHKASLAEPLHRLLDQSVAWQWGCQGRADIRGSLSALFLVAVDAYSHWVELVLMRSTTAESTVQALRRLFATHGLPDIVVSDNGPQFSSAVFQGFLAAQVIRHVPVAPYHPASNGWAERAVRSAKEALGCLDCGDWQTIQPVIMTIANNFVTDKNSGEVMTVGSVNHAQHYKLFFTDVVMSARTLIHLFQSLNPQMLQKKFRGKPTEATSEAKIHEYGELDVKDYIPGAEILALEKEGENDLEEEGDGWETASCSEEEDDEEGEWVDVHHSSDEEQQEIAGKTDRKEFVKKKTKLNPYASSTNKEKKKHKNFMMMRYSHNVRTKNKRSFREKQAS
ncbi:PREDICTED: uncharacterized protein LOC106549358 [Thamnophis sirtalis]|uniref:ribonuclease H n=1 Tax=Thamnophis sirtalis TaxID=35019 RepID=A0A6I9YE65_9SAUR|nr:PREDICTED: uncharacterized protein LOC106549358 [Thamnophis sirtalis]